MSDKHNPATWNVADTEAAHLGLACYGDSPYMSERVARICSADAGYWLAHTTEIDTDEILAVNQDCCQEASHLLSVLDQAQTDRTMADEWMEVMLLCQAVSYLCGAVTVIRDTPEELRPLLALAALQSVAAAANHNDHSSKFGWVMGPDGTPVGAVVVSPDELAKG